MPTHDWDNEDYDYKALLIEIADLLGRALKVPGVASDPEAVKEIENALEQVVRFDATRAQVKADELGDEATAIAGESWRYDYRAKFPSESLSRRRLVESGGEFDDNGRADFDFSQPGSFASRYRGEDITRSWMEPGKRDRVPNLVEDEAPSTYAALLNDCRRLPPPAAGCY